MYFEFGDKRWTFSVAPESLEGTPEWSDPSVTEPPLSVVEAVNISRAELPNYYPEEPIWDLKEVRLHTFATGELWFYMVAWYPRGVTTGDGLTIPVLMDGTALPLEEND